MPLPFAWSRTSVSSAAASSLGKSLSVTVNTAHMVYRMSSLRSRALGRCLSPLSAAVSVIGQSLVIRHGGVTSPVQVRRDLAGGGLRGRDARGDAHAVVGGARDGKARLAGDRRADGRDPVQVADVVLRQPAAPAGDPARDWCRCDPDGAGQVGGGERGPGLE